jgi:hypothetical protein
MTTKTNDPKLVTLTQTQLQATIEAAVQEALGKRDRSNPMAEKPKDTTKAAKVDDATIRAFRKAGFTGELKPRDNIKTFRQFALIGLIVKKGEKSTYVKPWRLFHVSQTRPMLEQEKALFAETEADKRQSKPRIEGLSPEQASQFSAVVGQIQAAKSEA